MSKFISLFILVCLLAINGAAATAGTRYTCVEQWFQGDKSKSDSTTSCKARTLDERGPYFAVLDDKAYFHVIVRESFTSSSGRGRRNTENIFEHRNFWPLPGAIQLDKLRTWSRSGRIAPRYATDGLRIFYKWRPIERADLASFEVLNARLTTDQGDTDETSDDSAWARDKNYLYFHGKSVANMLQNDVRRVGEKLIVSGGHVFEIEFDEIKERPDIDATLHQLNWAYSADKKHVYFRGQVVKGADPRSFEIMKPECPLKGHPNLRCDPAEKFEEDRHKAGFTYTRAPQAAGTYYWWGKDKNYVYQNQGRYEPWQEGNKKALSAKDIRFFLLPGKTASYFNPITQKYEIYSVSEVYIINLTHLYYKNFAIVSTRSSLRYHGTLSGPYGNGTLQDAQGYFSASMLERYGEVK
ncbi:MAG: hypothetical protein H6R01_187 [Burkholderiaceae bacterium]|nr:hypothetical protein [Burkholderiaceae bacterium]